MTGFRGIDIEADSALAAVIFSGTVTVAFITTVAGLLVAIPAVWSFNYLRTRIDLLESEISSDLPLRRSRHFRFTQKFPLAALFSTIPFPLIAAPSLAILVGVVFMEHSAYETPTGLDVSIMPAIRPCEGDRLIVLRVTGAGKLFINSEPEDWNGLSGRLSEIYSTRKEHTLPLVADDEVSFQTVADAIDIAKNAPVTGTSSSLDITVLLITPKSVDTHCLEPVVTRPSQHIQK